MLLQQARTVVTHDHFAEQRFMCTVRNFKCQKESLLIFLQLAMQQGLIVPLAFTHPGDEHSGINPRTHLNKKESAEVASVSRIAESAIIFAACHATIVSAYDDSDDGVTTITHGQDHQHNLTHTLP